MSSLKQVLLNSGWMLGGHLLKVISALLTSTIVARYLGPSGYGELSFTISYASLFLIFTGVSLNNFLRRDFIVKKESRGEFFGSALVLKFFGAICAVALVHFSIDFCGLDEGQEHLLMIYSISLLFMPLDLGQTLLEANLHSKYVTLSEVIQVVSFLALKALFVLTERSIYSFITLQVFEVLMRSLLQLAWVAKLRICPRPRVTYRAMKYLISESWPLFLSVGAVLFYQKIDQVMLRKMVSATEVGLYAVAAKVSAMTIFIPRILSRSMMPKLVDSHRKSRSDFDEAFGYYSMFMVLGMVAIAVMITLFSRWPIQWLYGEAYVGAFPILCVLIWKNVFLGVGNAASDWMLIEGVQRFIPIRQVLGAVVNVGLNLLLIPLFHGIGAAVASLLAFFLSGFLLLACIPSTRRCFVLVARSAYRVRGLKMLFKGIKTRGV